MKYRFWDIRGKTEPEEAKEPLTKPVTCRKEEHKICSASTAQYTIEGSKVNGNTKIHISLKYTGYTTIAPSFITLASELEAEDLANKLLEMTIRLGAGDE